MHGTCIKITEVLSSSSVSNKNVKFYYTVPDIYQYLIPFLTLHFNFILHDNLTSQVAILVICKQAENFHLNLAENVAR